MSSSREDPYPAGMVVEMTADEPEEDRYRGDRGTIVARDALGDLHVAWDKGRIEVWSVEEAVAKLRPLRGT